MEDGFETLPAPPKSDKGVSALSLRACMFLRGGSALATSPNGSHVSSDFACYVFASEVTGSALGYHASTNGHDA